MSQATTPLGEAADASMAAITTVIKDEVARVPLPPLSGALAEIATMIRFAGVVEVTHGEMTIAVTFDHRPTAQRFATLVRHLFEVPVQARAAGSKRDRSVVVTVTQRARDIVLQSGVVDRRGRAVRGLPAQVVGGTVADATAVCRAAFLVAGQLTESGRTAAMEVACPCPEAALALVGACRRRDITAKNREARGQDRMVIRDGESTSQLLRAMGAQETLSLWQERLKLRETRVAGGQRLANFDDANLRRSARAAIAASARVARALEILGEEVPEHLRMAGELRIEHRHASLEELGQLADPQMTKDAVAGRIRRLLSMADKRAGELGIADTQAAVTPDMFDDEPSV